MQDYYKILGVARNADSGEIRRAYEEKMEYYRTAYQGDRRDAREKCKELSGAYNMVGDYCERMKYDKILERMERFEEERSRAAAAPGAEEGTGPNMLWGLIGLMALALVTVAAGFIRL